MELGLDFDDSDFKEKSKDRPVLTSYNAKNCFPKWFLKEEADNGKNDKATLYKFRGDYHYSKGDYSEAAKHYQASLASLASKNRTMRREMAESTARCCIFTKEYSKALEYSRQMSAECLTTDQMCHALLLQQQIWRAAGKLLEEASVVHQLIQLHPFNANVWLILAQLYEKLSTIPLSNQNPCKRSHDHDVRTAPCDNVCVQHHCDSVVSPPVCQSTVKPDNADHIHLDLDKTTDTNTDCDEILTGFPCNLMELTCLVRVRLILQSVHGSVGTFVKDRNTELLKQVEERTQSLTADEEVLDAVSKFLWQDMYDDSAMFEGDEEQEDGKKTETQHDKSTDRDMSITEFNQKWFSWSSPFIGKTH